MTPGQVNIRVLRLYGISTHSSMLHTYPRHNSTLIWRSRGRNLVTFKRNDDSDIGEDWTENYSSKFQRYFWINLCERVSLITKPGMKNWKNNSTPTHTSPHHEYAICEMSNRKDSFVSTQERMREDNLQVIMISFGKSPKFFNCVNILSNRVNGSKQTQICVDLNNCFWQEQVVTVMLDLRGRRPALTPFGAKLYNHLTDWLTDSMERSASWEACGLSASQEIPSVTSISELYSPFRSYPSESCERCQSHPHLCL